MENGMFSGPPVRLPSIEVANLMTREARESFRESAQTQVRLERLL
jgi:hypothetical protein